MLFRITSHEKVTAMKFKYKSRQLFLSILLLQPFLLFAQTKGEQQETDIISRIQEESEGRITIDVPENILEKLLNPQESNRPKNNETLHSGVNKLSGFRIQVFSDGRNQYTLESRAKARGSAILAKFPKYRGQIYTFSQSPNWYTRVGNFRTQAEANSALAELKRAFPAFAREMRIVKSKIVVIK